MAGLVTAACNDGFLQERLEEEQPDEAPTPEVPPSERPAGGLAIDTSATSRFVVGMPESVTVLGRVSAPRGLASLSVDGAAVTPGADGGFSQAVAVEPGLRFIEVTATDAGSPSASRDGHLSLMVSSYRADGELNPTAGAFTIVQGALPSIEGPLRTALSATDVAGALPETFSQSGCEITITGGSNGPPDLSLSLPSDGWLGLVVIVPSLHVEFDGTCEALGFSFDGTGTIDTDVIVRSSVSAPAAGRCVERLEHRAPEVELVNFDLGLSGSGIVGLVAPLVAELAEGSVADSIRDIVTEEADGVLAEQLTAVADYDIGATVDLMGASADVSLCLTGLVPESAGPRAIIGAAVQSGGGGDAPGAPYLQTAVPPAEPGTLLLDAGFVGQLLFAAWRAGLLDRADATEVDLGLLTLLAPDIERLYPGVETASVSIEGRLPALVTAAPDGERGDLILELGELDVVLSVEGDELFRVGAALRITLDLAPEGMALRPAVGPVTATVYVLEEPVVDIDDEALSEAIELQLPSMVAELLGSQSIPLPTSGLAADLALSDVTPVPGTSFLLVSFE